MDWGGRGKTCFRRWGRYGEVDGDTKHGSIFKDPEPASWMHVTDIGMIVWQEIRTDGGLPPWGSVKEQAMSLLCHRLLFMSKKSESDLMSTR